MQNKFKSLILSLFILIKIFLKLVHSGFTN
nr:MAG TPA: hypothetical protein [Caudoviricetes sp.]